MRVDKNFLRNTKQVGARKKKQIWCEINISDEI